MHYHISLTIPQQEKTRPFAIFSLLSLLGKLHPENEMLETESVHLVACRDSIAVVRKADESKALGHAGFPVLGKEDSGDTTEALEHIAQFSLFRHLGDLLQRKDALAGLHIFVYTTEKAVDVRW